MDNDIATTTAISKKADTASETQLAEKDRQIEELRRQLQEQTEAKEKDQRRAAIQSRIHPIFYAYN